jgi:hypothetical protein
MVQYNQDVNLLKEEAYGSVTGLQGERQVLRSGANFV